MQEHFDKQYDELRSLITTLRPPMTYVESLMDKDEYIHHSYAQFKISQVYIWLSSGIIDRKSVDYAINSKMRFCLALDSYFKRKEFYDHHGKDEYLKAVLAGKI
jgi:hypothetical protein